MKQYAAVVLEITKDGDFNTIHFGEMKTKKDAVKMAQRRSLVEGLIMGVDCYQETEMTTYNPIYLEVYCNGKKITRINY